MLSTSCVMDDDNFGRTCDRGKTHTMNTFSSLTSTVKASLFNSPSGEIIRNCLLSQPLHYQRNALIAIIKSISTPLSTLYHIVRFILYIIYIITVIRIIVIIAYTFIYCLILNYASHSVNGSYVLY